MFNIFHFLLLKGYDSMGFELSKPQLRAELEADLKKYDIVETIFNKVVMISLFLPGFVKVPKLGTVSVYSVHDWTLPLVLLVPTTEVLTSMLDRYQQVFDNANQQVRGDF